MSAARASISLGFTFRTLRSESASLFSWMVWMVIFHSFRRSRCLRPAALTRWRSAGWGGGSKIDGSGAGGASREAPARASAPELAELVEQPGPVDYASGTKGRVPLVFPPVATATTDGARPWAARSYVAADRLLGARPWPLIFSARGPLISRPPVSVICLRAMLRRHAPLRFRRSAPAVPSMRRAR